MTTTPIPPLPAAKLLSRHEVAEGTMAFRFVSQVQPAKALALTRGPEHSASPTEHGFT